MNVEIGELIVYMIYVSWLFNILVVIYFVFKEGLTKIRIWYLTVGRWKYECLKPRNLDELIKA
jgi:hypothetical protein